MQPKLRYFLLGATLLLSLLGAPPVAANIVIDNDDILGVASYSQATMDRIAQYSFYFEHASVGGNMIGGLATLHSGNSSFYRLTTSSVSGTAPSTIGTGVVYENNRGNPGWSAKIATFATDITNSWGGKTTFALNKFCWIDETANWSAYANSIATLEAANPSTTFVYMTMPLNTGTGSDNVLRNQFNSALRLWAADNNKILFDVADIETHDAAGVSQTFTYDGATYNRMADEWTSDGGHPNLKGSDQRLALGFYALAAEFTAVPEPSTYAAIFGLATLGLVVWQRCRSTRHKP
jgi:hypothetical protein